MSTSASLFTGGAFVRNRSLSMSDFAVHNDTCVLFIVTGVRVQWCVSARSKDHQKVVYRLLVQACLLLGMPRYQVPRMKVAPPRRCGSLILSWSYRWKCSRAWQVVWIVYLCLQCWLECLDALQVLEEVKRYKLPANVNKRVNRVSYPELLCDVILWSVWRQ